MGDRPNMAEDDRMSSGRDHQERLERKKQRERTRRKEEATAFAQLSSLLAQIEPEEKNQRRTVVRSGEQQSDATRLDLITRTIEAVRQLHEENVRLRRQIADQETMRRSAVADPDQGQKQDVFVFVPSLHEMVESQHQYKRHRPDLSSSARPHMGDGPSSPSNQGSYRPASHPPYPYQHEHRAYDPDIAQQQQYHHSGSDGPGAMMMNYAGAAGSRRPSYATYEHAGHPSPPRDGWFTGNPRPFQPPLMILPPTTASQAPFPDHFPPGRHERGRERDAPSPKTFPDQAHQARRKRDSREKRSSPSVDELVQPSSTSKDSSPRLSPVPYYPSRSSPTHYRDDNSGGLHPASSLEAD